MFQGSFPLTEDEIFTQSFRRWPNAGCDAPTGFWTANISESPNVAAVCSLSEVLEDSQSVPKRFFLSPRAASGILRRASARGRVLPPRLEGALVALASTNHAAAGKTTRTL